MNISEEVRRLGTLVVKSI